MKLNPRSLASRELKITFGIWSLLILAAVIALLLLNTNSRSILERIYYVNVSRGIKANVIYAEARSEAKNALEATETLNLDSNKKLSLPVNNPHYSRCLELFDKAFRLDIRPEFDVARTEDYELLGQIYDAAGFREGQLLTHARAFISQKNYKDARSYIEAADQLSSGGLEPLLLDAQLTALEGNTTRAIVLLNDANSSSALSAKGFSILGSLYQDTGEIQKAVKYLSKAVSMAETDLDYRLQLGLALMISGKRSEANKTLQAGLDDGAWMDPAYLHQYGDSLSDNGDLDEAIRILKQADKLAPNSGDVQWSLARAYHKAGQPRQADSALRRATTIKPVLHDQIF